MKRVPISQFASTRTYIQQNPEVIERWVRAYNKGIDWVNQNQGSEEWLKLIAVHTRLTPDQIRNIAIPVWDKTVDPAAVEKIVAVMRKHGLLEGGNVDVKGMLHTTATSAVN
jgi:NitT/TauT family transport system substrate-binding protein